VDKKILVLPLKDGTETKVDPSPLQQCGALEAVKRINDRLSELGDQKLMMMQAPPSSLSLNMFIPTVFKPPARVAPLGG